MGTKSSDLSVGDNRSHLQGVLKELHDVMLGTYESTGDRPLLRSRPMHITKLEADCGLWFMTALDGEAARQVALFGSAVVTSQSHSRYVSLVGDGSVVSERATIALLWSKLHEVWFPQGPDDPRVCLIHFVPREGEFWDLSSTKGFRYLFEAAKALLTQEPPPHRDDEHARVKLPTQGRGDA